ncbi:MAG TPA: GNAT family N-acetyltransferase [Bacilli bacterium]
MKIRLATNEDLNGILEIVQDAINLLKQNNVNQWQNGYPNRDVFIKDIENQTLYVLCDNSIIVGFCNISPLPDPSYKVIYEGSWLTDVEEYVVIHRLAVRKENYHCNCARTLIEFAYKIAKENHKISIRVDTHHDNIPMNRLLQKMGFIKCGIIHLIGYSDAEKARVAYEKII